MIYEFTVIFRDDFMPDKKGEVYTQVIEWDTDEIDSCDFPKVAYKLAESSASEFMETIEGEEETLRAMANLIEVFGVTEGNVYIETYCPESPPVMPSRLKLATHNGNHLSH